MPRPRNRGLFRAGGGVFPLLGITTTPELLDNFNRADADVIGGNWDSHYLHSTWALANLGGQTWKIRSNKLRGDGINPIKSVETSTLMSGRNIYAQIVNHQSFTSGNNRQFRLLINVGRQGTTAGTYYYGMFGRVGGVVTVSIGKYWNNTDVVLATAAQAVPVGALVRVRHDGVGKLFLDIDNVTVLQTAIDACYLRARGVGIGYSGQNNGDTHEADDFQAGVWGTIPVPSPWYMGDAFDTDSIASGVWTKSGTTQPSIGEDGARGGKMLSFQSGQGTVYGALADASLLSADQYVEATMDTDNSVYDVYAILRSAAAGQGYYFRWDTTNGWAIGRLGVGIIASSAAGSPGSENRIRAEAQGTALRLYHWTGGAWSLKVSTTDSNISAAGTVRFGFNDVGGQGVPQLHDVVVGNL
jgi:hypothetical protein